MDDGTEPFGELREWTREPEDFDTPEWRAEMEAKYPCLDM